MSTRVVSFETAKKAKEKRDYARLVMDCWDAEERETKRAHKLDAETVNQRNREKL